MITDFDPETVSDPLRAHLGHSLGDALGAEGGGVVEGEVGVPRRGEGGIRHGGGIRPISEHK